MTGTQNDKAIVLFDGVCNFCNSSVNHIIRLDRKDHFRFAPIQSETGKKFLAAHHIDPQKTDSIILIENGKAYVRSTAILRIHKQLGGLWSWLYGFIIIPPFLRNAVYDLVARNRYKWFGKKDSCMIPTAEMRGKFLA